MNGHETPTTNTSSPSGRLTPDSSFKSTPLSSPASYTPPSGAALLLFGGCCSSGTPDSWGEHVVEHPSANENCNTGEFIKRLTEAEIEGRRIVHVARMKRRDALERARNEARGEAQLYAEQFEIEFKKLEIRVSNY